MLYINIGLRLWNHTERSKKLIIAEYRVGNYKGDKKMKKKLLSAILSTAMVASLLVGCGAKAEAPAAEAPAATEAAEADDAEEVEEEEEEVAEVAEGEGQVYYLNFKP